MVEEGAPFCPECRAPQIRVNIPSGAEPAQREADTAATPPFPPGTPGDLQPPAQRVPLATRPRLRDAFGSALAASLLVVTCLLFWPSAFAFILVVGGAFAVLLYHRRRPEAHLTAGGAARVGATTGLLCALLFVLKFLTEFLSDGGAAMKQSMIERIRAMSSSNPEAAQRLLTDINQPDYFAAVVVVGIIIVAVLFIASSALGGVVAGRLLRREPR